MDAKTYFTDYYSKQWFNSLSYCICGSSHESRRNGSSRHHMLQFLKAHIPTVGNVCFFIMANKDISSNGMFHYPLTNANEYLVCTFYQEVLI